MAERSFFSWITNNWLPKIICLLIAIILFLVYRTTSLSTRKINIDIDAVHTEKYIPVNAYTKTMVVEIRGESEKIMNITDREVKAFIDFSECKGEGPANMDIHVRFSPAVQLIDPIEVITSLETVYVVVEKRAFADVNIDLQLFGAVAGGYQLVSHSVTPEVVHVSGPQSIVDNLNGHLHINYDITGQRYSFSNNVDIADFLDPDSNLTVVSTGVLEISAKIEPIVIRESFKNLHVTFVGLAEKFNLTQLTPVNLEIESIKETMESFSAGMITIVADCSAINGSGDFDLPLKIDLPDGVVLFSPERPVVKVHVE